MNTLGRIILCFGNLGVILCIGIDYNIAFDRVEGVPGDEETIVEWQMRMTRKGNEYLANGNLTHHEELGEDVTHMVTSTYSSDGSSLFRTHPYTVQKSSICEYYRTIYRQYGQPWTRGHTDFPEVPKEGICPVPKGTWYIRDVSLLNGTQIPMHAPRGLWKLEQIHERNGKKIGGLMLYARVSDKF